MVILRYGLSNLLLISAIVALMIGGQVIILVMAVALAVLGPIDEAAGDDRAPVGNAGRLFYVANMYVTAPLLAVLTVVSVLRAVMLWDQDAFLLWLRFPLLAIVIGYFYALNGATVGHELTHWTNDRFAQFSTRVMLAFMFNTSFALYHVHGHHRSVGYLDDAATARRGENAFAFVLRTVVRQFTEAFRFEAERLQRENRSPYSWRNRALSGQIYSLVIVVSVWALGGWVGVMFFLGAAAFGRLSHELMNYVQHYGLVRAEGERLDTRHTWDCYRIISNAFHYNLPRHSQHHLFAARAFWELEAVPDAPMLPYGYQTMAALAVVPPLWRRMMGPLLADWDRRFASETELRLIRERGWSGLV